MNTWRSPLLIFGIAVILIAGGALFAPYFINWGNYREVVENYGRQMTGRETKVTGDISVRLFPWPRMKIKDVKIANPPGAVVKELFRADEVEIRLRLAPLLSGKLEVEGIDINRPVIGLERLAGGKSSWHLQPEVSLGNMFGAEDVAVSGVSITNGTIVLADGQRGGEAQIDGFNAFVSARSLNGPWKLRGEAIINDQNVTISVNTGQWKAGEPLKFGLRLAPFEGAGLTYSFDGASSAGEVQEISGKLKIVPTTSKNGKADGQTNFRPVVFRADVKANFDEVKFSEIEVAPKNAVDVRTFVTGEASVKFGSVIRLDANLKAARFDVDSILGNKGRKTLRSLDSLDSIAGFVENLPKNIHLHSVIDLTTLVVAGQELDGVVMDLDMVESRLKINHLAAILPGQTKATFTGSLLAGKRQPQLIGDLTLDMINLKDFSKWVFVDYKREIEKKWSGARGNFNLVAKADLSREHFRLNDGQFKLDNAKGSLGLSITTGNEPAIAIQLVASELDIDQYAPDGLLDEAGKADVPGLFLETLTKLVSERDISLVARTDKLVMNGVVAHDVGLEFIANENAVEFRQVKLGQVGDSFVDLTGLVKFSDENVTGSINGQVMASDPSKLVKLISAIDAPKDWIDAVSPVVLKINGQTTAGEKETTGSVHVSGSAGKTKISGSGRFSGTVSQWQDAKVHLSGQLSGDSAKSLLAIFDVKAPRGEDGAGRIAITATGKLSEGLATSADMDAFGVHSQFSGRIDSDEKKGGAWVKASGRLGVLIENTDQLYGIVGLDTDGASPIGKVFSGEGVLTLDRIAFDLKDIHGTAVGTSFGGALNFEFNKSQPVLKMNIQAGRLSLPFALGAAMLGRDGKRHSAATRFSPQALAGVKVDIHIKAGKLEIWPGFEVQKAGFDLTGNKGMLKLVANGENAKGKSVKLELDANVGTQLTRVSGKLSGAVAIENVLVTNAGTGVVAGDISIEGEFAGSGRTPGGLLASLGGNGIYAVSDGIVKNISPERFAEKLAQAETAKDVEDMIASLLRVGDMKFGSGKGEIKLENGVASFSPLAISGPGAHGKIRTLFEIANGLGDVSIRLKLEQPADVPGFEIAYAGPPDGLAPSSDFAALKSHLSVTAINRTLDKLEALEEEQRRLVEEEKKARMEAEMQRKAQQEKQRLLREKQRKLLEDATKKKEQDAAKKKELEAARKRELEAEKKRQQEIVLPKQKPLPPTVVITPLPETSSFGQIPPPPAIVRNSPRVKVKKAIPRSENSNPVNIQPGVAKKKRPKLGYRGKNNMGADR